MQQHGSGYASQLHAACGVEARFASSEEHAPNSAMHSMIDNRLISILSEYLSWSLHKDETDPRYEPRRLRAARVGGR